MHALEDAALMSAYVSQRSEQAFALLVDRHVALVYSSALRQVRDPHLAEEITQTVFITLARKAGGLGKETILAGWLCRTVHFTARNILKRTARRRHYEQEAQMESISQDPAPDLWPQIAPLLDEAMAQLGDSDRDALVLRYYQQKPLAEVGRLLEVSEDTAQKRVSRALEKLRDIFIQRGVTLTTVVIASAVAANAVSAAPAGLAVTIKAASLTAAGTTTFTFAKLMTLTNLKFIVGALAIAGVAAAFVVQNQAQTKLRDDNVAMQQKLKQAQADNVALASQLATVSNSVARSLDQFNELLKLRGQVGLLQHQAAAAEKLRAENQRLMALRENPAATTEAMDPEAQQQVESRKKVSDARQGVLGIILFSSDNQGLCPTNYAQMASYFKQGWNGTNDFDFVYQGSLPDIAHPNDTIVLREKQAWQTLGGKWAKVYGFADGHSELHVTPDGNFDEWESQRLLLPPVGQ